MQPSPKPEEVRPDLNLPWCSKCRLHSDYRNVLGNVTRMNPDEGTYTENLEIPHCLKCNRKMYLIKDYKALLLTINIFLSLAWVSLVLCSIYVFPLKEYFWPAFLAYTSLVVFLWFAPTKARRRHLEWKKWAEEQNSWSLIEE